MGEELFQRKMKEADEVQINIGFPIVEVRVSLYLDGKIHRFHSKTPTWRFEQFLVLKLNLKHFSFVFVKIETLRASQSYV